MSQGADIWGIAEGNALVVGVLAALFVGAVTFYLGRRWLDHRRSQRSLR